MKNYLPHQQRVVDEKSELDIKIKALGEFILGNKIYEGLDSEEKERLKEQHHYMSRYSEILEQRISNF